MQTFNNSTDAFEFYYDKILEEGIERDGTKALFNIGFEIKNTINNIIDTPWRKFSEEYSEAEWRWFMSGNRKVDEIGKIAPIWLKHTNENGEVNSNYGYQWQRNGQLDYVINELKRNPLSRRAVISIYDGKEHSGYKKDTPCTLTIHFQIVDNKLCITVNMRSNDLVWGFCNDQYQFINLQKLVSKELGLELGWYYHFANNLHIYKRHYNLKENYEKNK